MTGCIAQIAPQEPPSDFAVTAQFIASPLGMSGVSWKLTVENNGRVTREAFYFYPPKKEIDTKHPSLTPEQLNGLAHAIEEASYFKIPDIETTWTDAPVNLFRVTMNGKTREVRAQGLSNEDVRNSDAGKRIRKIWWELLHRVPSPDPKHEESGPSRVLRGGVLG